MQKYVLKNKDEPVLAVKTEENRFLEIKDVYSPELIPLGASRDGEVTAESLSEWWQNMSVPGTRDNLRLGTECLNGKNYGDGKKRWESIEQVRFMGLGLSLNNHYWLEPEGECHKWSDINYYENAFAPEMGIALFNHKPVEAVKGSPDTALNGQLEKKWTIDNKTRVLVKKGGIRAVNEVFAGDIADILGLEAVKYTLAVEDNSLTCRCVCFTDNEWEFIPGMDILRTYPLKPGENPYIHWVETLEVLGVPKAEEHTGKMLCLDYIIRNTDRHYNNMGVLFNRRKNEYKMAPVYDTGTSMHYGNLVVDNSPFHMLPFGVSGEHVLGRYSVDTGRLSQCLEKYAHSISKYDIVPEKRVKKVTEACLDRAV